MYRNYVKRIIDVIVSFITLPLFSLLCIPIGIMIKLDDGGPVFYAGKRLGKGLKEFPMLKFRTMKVNAPDIRNEDGSTFNSDDDPRLTKIGKLLRKTSLDEIPQIVNVLKGDMSLVGPRPSPLGNRNKYSKEYLRKFEVKPGITGYNQATLRNSSTQQQRETNDLYYVDNLGFGLDLKIIGMTISMVLTARSINRHTNDSSITQKP